jgi:hypothetical protein
MTRRLAPQDAASPRRRSQRGAALVFALFGLAVMTILGVGLTSLGMMATKMTSNERDTQQAIALADAGLSHARKLITYQEWDWANMTPLLVSGDGTACNGDELAQAPPGVPAGYPTLFIRSAALGGQPFGAGSYRVYVCDDHLTDRDLDTNVLDGNPNADVNRRILVRSVGTTANGATATVEQVFGSSTAPALLVNGPLSVRGDVDVTGSGGIIHSNGTMDIVGNSVCAEQFFSSTQQITGGIPEGGAGCDEDGEVRPGSAPINIRQIYPSNYRWRADYWLDFSYGPTGPGGAMRATGVVRQNLSANHPATSDADFTVIPTPAGWTFSDNRLVWSTNGGNGVEMPRAIYYARTNVDLGGNVDATVIPPPPAAQPPVGSPGSTPGMTVLSEGWIKIGGGAHLIGKLSITPGIGLITMVAGTDIDVAGNAGCGVAVCHVGLYYARHQIEMSGTPVVSGQVIALNQADTIYPTAAYNQVNAINLVPLVFGYMKISGNPTITYNGGGMMGTRALTWRECRTPDPADVLPAMAGLIAADDACGNLYGGT